MINNSLFSILVQTYGENLALQLEDVDSDDADMLIEEYLGGQVTKLYIVTNRNGTISVIKEEKNDKKDDEPF